MSMFYELMMRKKTEYLYPVIKGSLTDAGGVISNFSSSNYLLFRNSITNIQTAEIIIDCTIGSDLNNIGMTIFSCSQWSIQLYKQSTSDTKYNLNYGGQNLKGTKNFEADEHIKIKILSQDSRLKIYYYDFNNNVWILDYILYSSDAGWSSVDKTKLVNVVFGDNQSHNGSRVFTGSMNLNASSIKINSTKYNLQAVVGYTIVGSPTIVDGVVSGFGANSYIKTATSMSYNNSFEMFVEFTFGNDITSVNQMILCEQNNNIRLWKLGSESFIKMRFYDSAISDFRTLNLTYAVQPNTTYKCKAVFKNSKLELFLYDGNNNLLEEKSIDNVKVLINQHIKYGSIGTSSAYFLGTINLPTTYIKINNKLWFNGQEG